MADYYHLDVYKSSYKLLCELYISLKNLNKEHKYTIGEKIKERAFEVLLTIYSANELINKVPALSEALREVEYIRLAVRLLRDLNALNDKKFVNLSVIIDDVSSQFQKWRRYEEQKRW
jgi:hypothetical protein